MATVNASFSDTDSDYEPPPSLDYERARRTKCQNTTNTAEDRMSSIIEATPRSSKGFSMESDEVQEEDGIMRIETPHFLVLHRKFHFW